ncbi:hypothetical protein SESBI_30548 [Sesbania bispinosa]|nr:hypothetical protein SESBI_30548 [Sesbania bispinosa]
MVVKVVGCAGANGEPKKEFKSQRLDDVALDGGLDGNESKGERSELRLGDTVTVIFGCLGGLWELGHGREWW